MSQSALFNGIVAHVLGRPVAIARTPQTAALGAAAVAAPALGLYATVREAVAHIGHPMTVIEPDLHLAGMYEDAYERWRSVAERLNRA
jgi:sugar (pentulose or hexulose) kinase